LGSEIDRFRQIVYLQWLIGVLFSAFRASSPSPKPAKSPGEYPIVCRPYSRKAKEFKEFVAGGCADPGGLSKRSLVGAKARSGLADQR
jgi:hypothetical protein